MNAPCPRTAGRNKLGAELSESSRCKKGEQTRGKMKSKVLLQIRHKPKVAAGLWFCAASFVVLAAAPKRGHAAQLARRARRAPRRIRRSQVLCRGTHASSLPALLSGIMCLDIWVSHAIKFNARGRSAARVMRLYVPWANLFLMVRKGMIFLSLVGTFCIAGL